MRSRLLVAFLCAAALLAGAGEAFARGRGAFEQHLRDAIRLNQARRPLYSEQSNGASEAVSDRLILEERLVLPVAIVVDRFARWWQERGVPIVVEDFVGMDRAPAFEAKSAHPQPLSEFQRQNGWAIAGRIRKAGKAGGFAGVCKAVNVELTRLSTVPTYHAMLRHVLESALRAAYLAPKHEALALSKGLPTTAGISRRLVELNLLALASATALDEKAAPVHALGVRILHRDVPPIDTRSDFYDHAANAH